MRSSGRGALALAGLLLAWAACVRADVMVLVRADSPVQALSAAEAREIFVNDRRRGLNTLDLPETDPARQTFYQVLAGRNTTMMRALRARLVFSGQGRPPQQLEAEPLIARLQADRDAIGYLPAGAVPDGLRVVLSLDAPR